MECNQFRRHLTDDRILVNIQPSCRRLLFLDEGCLHGASVNLLWLGNPYLAQVSLSNVKAKKYQIKNGV